MADDKNRGIDELLNELPPEDARRIVETLGRSLSQAVLDNIQSKIKTEFMPNIRKYIQDMSGNPEFRKDIQEMTGYSDAVASEVEAITSETGDSKEDVLLKALLLYEEALEASQNGQRLVVVGPDYRYIKEIVGLRRGEPEPAPSGNNAR